MSISFPLRHRIAARRLVVESLEARCVLSAGDLDPTFDHDGQVQTGFGGGGHVDVAQSVIIQPGDGKIVAGGFHQTAGGSDFALARYNKDGSLDTSFSFDGKVTTDFDGHDESISALAVQNDGKIVAVGSAQAPHDGPGGQPVSDRAFALARYNPDGTLDLNFGPNGNGRVTTDFFGDDDRATGVAVLQDGKIVVGGWCTLPGYNSREFALARYLPNGILDLTFGPNGDGKVTTLVSGASAVALAVQMADDKIVLAGSDSGGTFWVVRYTSDGALDTGGGQGGMSSMFMQLGAAARSLAIQSDGRILVGGEVGGPGTALARFLPDLQPDHDFDADGRVFTSSGPAWGIAIQPNGRIVAAGAYDLQRFLPDGTLDPSFGSGGHQYYVLNELHSLALQADGKIVAAGVLVVNANFDFALIRVFGNNYRISQSRGTLSVQGTQLADIVNIADDGAGNITVGDSAGDVGMFAGIDRVEIDTGDGDDVVNFQVGSPTRLGGTETGGELLPPMHPAGFQINLGDGNDRCALNAYFPADGRQRMGGDRWIGDVQAGDGDDRLSFGSVGPIAADLNLTADLGAGRDVFDFNAAAGWNNPPAGMRGISVMAGVGDDAVTMNFGGVVEANLAINVDLGTGQDSFLLDAAAGWQAPPEGGNSSINVAGGSGDDIVRLGFGAVIAADLDISANLGAGRDSFDVNVAGSWSNPPVGMRSISLMAGAGDDAVTMNFGGVVEANLVINVDLGAGHDSFLLDAAAGWQAPPEGGNLSINVVGGSGDDIVRLSFGGVIAADLDMSADLGAGRDVFDFNAAAGWANPPAGTRGISVAAGSGDDDVALHLGGIVEANLTIAVDLGDGQDRFQFDELDGWLAPPEGGSSSLRVLGGAGEDTIALRLDHVDAVLSMLLDGGDGKDTIFADLTVAARAMHRLDAQVLGGGNNDDLTLDIFGVGDPDFLTALIDGGPGIDAAHHTSNVRVVNCER